MEELRAKTTHFNHLFIVFLRVKKRLQLSYEKESICLPAHSLG